ncbi:MAG: 50S ribosomal protein L4 [Candidatus Dojkabacteria bacterium]|nr:MAG: 50S ribosomal protein L4 [Candidatus Dojkabacteria bacterium]
MQAQTFTKTGTKAKEAVKLDKSVFGAEINQALIDQSVYVYLSNQRQANAHSKNRGDVSGGGKKPWRQKGTGRARHGSSRSPIWTGGGVTFGPTNNRNYKKSLSKKMKKAAMRSALSYLQANNKVSVFEGFDIAETKKTAGLKAILNKAGIEGKTIVLQGKLDDELLLAARNIKSIIMSHVGEINVYSLLNADNVIIIESALEEITNKWGEKQAVVKEEKPKVVKVSNKSEKK